MAVRISKLRHEPYTSNVGGNGDLHWRSTCRTSQGGLGRWKSNGEAGLVLSKNVEHIDHASPLKVPDPLRLHIPNPRDRPCIWLLEKMLGCVRVWLLLCYNCTVGIRQLLWPCSDLGKTRKTFCLKATYLFLRVVPVRPWNCTSNVAALLYLW